MSKELYLYTGIFGFTAESLISGINDNMGKPATIRVNTPGGSLFATWGIVAKMREHGDITISVDGMAMSGGAFMLPYAKKRKALSVSKIMIHRADMTVESPEDQKFLDDINADLKAEFLKQIDGAKFALITGYTIDQIFDPTSRIDVYLSAQQALEVGLIDEIIQLTDEEVTAFNNKLSEIAAFSNTPIVQKVNAHINMDLNKLKAEHPTVFAEAVALGVSQEKDRVGSWLAWNTIDPKAVAEGIEAGTQVTPKVISEFSVKAVSANMLANVEKDKVVDVKLPEAGQVAASADPVKDEKIAAFEAEKKQALAQRLGKDPK